MDIIHSVKRNIARLLTALGALMLASAVVHIFLVWTFFFLSHDPSVISPLRLYGLDTLFPETTQSHAVTFIGWGTLFMAFIVIAFIFFRLNLSLTITVKKKTRSNLINMCRPLQVSDQKFANVNSAQHSQLETPVTQ